MTVPDAAEKYLTIAKMTKTTFGDSRVAVEGWIKERREELYFDASYYSF